MLREEAKVQYWTDSILYRFNTEAMFLLVSLFQVCSIHGQLSLQMENPQVCKANCNSQLLRGQNTEKWPVLFVPDWHQVCARAEWSMTHGEQLGGFYSLEIIIEATVHCLPKGRLARLTDTGKKSSTKKATSVDGFELIRMAQKTNLCRLCGRQKKFQIQQTWILSPVRHMTLTMLLNFSVLCFSCYKWRK